MKINTDTLEDTKLPTLIMSTRGEYPPKFLILLTEKTVLLLLSNKGVNIVTIIYDFHTP